MIVMSTQEGVETLHLIMHRNGRTIIFFNPHGILVSFSSYSLNFPPFLTFVAIFQLPPKKFKVRDGRKHGLSSNRAVLTSIYLKTVNFVGHNLIGHWQYLKITFTDVPYVLRSPL